MRHLREGNLHNPTIYVVSDFLRVEEKAESQVLSGHRRTILLSAFSRSNISINDYCLDILYPTMPYERKLANVNSDEARQWREELKKRILDAKPNVIVPLGNAALEFVTGLTGIHKWHCSILKARAELGGIKAVPLLHPNEVFKTYTNVAYYSFGCSRIKEESLLPKMNIPSRNFLLNPSFEDTITYLNDVALKSEYLAVDVETSSGQINTFGLATSPTEAIAIETMPSSYTPEQYHQLWLKIAEVMRSPIPKVFQNFMYDVQFLSRYGVWTNAIYHDTMVCMKFLHPEMEAGLHNVGRLYTPYPYWKEDGKDWTNISNWYEHLKYNAKDTTGTLTAFHNQVKDLEDRGLTDLFYKFVMKFSSPVREMCSRGLLVDELVLTQIRKKVADDIKALERSLDELTLERVGYNVNPRSPAQLKTLLKDMGLRIPIFKGKESTDKKSLIKLKKKHPKEEILNVLLKLAAKNKMLSSYLKFTYDSDKRVRYSLNIHGTETGRFAGYKDERGNGFNPQTVPSFLKKVFAAPEGYTIVQIDLAQAESRYVAWESHDPLLMEMITKGEDVHRFVAGHILGKDPVDITKKERQLGKKSGHAANYGVGPRTFADACLTELDMPISQTKAAQIINAYHELFPGIRRRQMDIQEKLKRYRKLSTPMGRERIFYGRMDDQTFREAYAYAPQSTIPDITNCLMLYLYGKCRLLLQVHDSLLLEVPNDQLRQIQELAYDYDKWHPDIQLPGGKLVIPVDFEYGPSWGLVK